VGYPTIETGMTDNLIELLRPIRLLAMDVDGVLTDGSITYDDEGRELKRFHVADGLGMTALLLADIQIAWITGRSSAAVARRANELRISHVMQGVRDKGAALQALTADLNLCQDEVAYAGDDWNDLLAFEASGVRFAVSNAVPQVKAAADVVTAAPGGTGAIREICDRLLEAKGLTADIVAAYLNALKETVADVSVGQ